MIKKALLISNSYLATQSRLKGTENDAMLLSLILAKKGYTSIKMEKNRTDKQMITSMTEFVDDLNKTALLNKTSKINAVFYFSGHGTTQFTGNVKELDGCDEFILGNNLQRIKDDVITNIFSRLSSAVTLYAICDCCHSGTVFDLQYDYVNGNLVDYKINPNKSRIVYFGASTDRQTAKELPQGKNKTINGLFTKLLCDSANAIIDKNETLYIGSLYETLYKEMKKKNLDQLPSLSSSFVFTDIEFL